MNPSVRFTMQSFDVNFLDPRSLKEYINELFDIYCALFSFFLQIIHDKLLKISTPILQQLMRKCETSYKSIVMPSETA